VSSWLRRSCKAAHSMQRLRVHRFMRSTDVRQMCLYGIVALSLGVVRFLPQPSTHCCICINKCSTTSETHAVLAAAKYVMPQFHLENGKSCHVLGCVFSHNVLPAALPFCRFASHNQHYCQPVYRIVFRCVTHLSATMHSQSQSCLLRLELSKQFISTNSSYFFLCRCMH
jgi:hypothetical protein